MHDIIPEMSEKWRNLEKILANTAKRFGYNEIRTPILENSTLFSRSIGGETDIVNKEMYSFLDRNEESLTMRPEGTASVARAMLQAGLLRSPGQKVWYLGPMFRYERPQKGRLRQFHQFGLEAFGLSDPNIELEMMSFCDNIWQQLGINNKLKLEINTLGTSDCRASFKNDLVSFFLKHKAVLSEEELIRLEKNPLRLLDSKNPKIKELLKSAPKLINSICDEELQKFTKLKDSLTALGIKYEVNPHLVRGLDYYNGTVFEWTTTSLGAQGTVCAGGRYDNLIGMLTKGETTPAFGFALGIERILELIEIPTEKENSIYMIALESDTNLAIAELAQELRNKLKIIIRVDLVESSIKAKFKRAASYAADLAIILGKDEIKSNTITVKNLNDGEQQEIGRDEIIPFLINYFGAEYESI